VIGASGRTSVWSGCWAWAGTVAFSQSATPATRATPGSAGLAAGGPGCCRCSASVLGQERCCSSPLSWRPGARPTFCGESADQQPRRARQHGRSVSRFRAGGPAPQAAAAPGTPEASGAGSARAPNSGGNTSTTKPASRARIPPRVAKPWAVCEDWGRFGSRSSVGPTPTGGNW